MTEAPFLHSGDATRFRMLDAAIALLPAAAGAVWFFGARAAALVLLSVGCCVGLEWLDGRLRGRGCVRDGSALVTGLLLALLLPPDCPLWAVPLGALAAVGGKLLSGGLGRNVLNPAAFGRAILLLLPAFRSAPPPQSLSGLLMGYHGGGLGEASTLLLLAGAAYLAARRLLPWTIAPVYLTAAFFTGFWIPGCDPLAVLLWGGTVLGACFLSADPVTSPMGLTARLLCGAAAGVFSTLLAWHGWGVGGVCCGVLLTNLLFRAAEAAR